MDARGATLGQPGASGDVAALHIRLLGEFALRRGREPVGSFDSPRLQSLLACLLLHGDAPQSRERIAFRLWPDSTEGQAKTNLRQLVHQLRRRLGEADRYIEATAQTLRWRPGAVVWCDAVEFDRAADIAVGPGASVAELARAADLYVGDLLPGGYDDWLVEERERLRCRHTEILERLVEFLSEQRNYRRASDYAELLLRRDPLHEATYRRLMRLHVLRGERARAVRIYHACAGVLERELGVEPDPATTALYESLLIDRGRAEVRPDAVPHAASHARARLVGRATEWDQATAAWRVAASESASLLAVVGEAGIGKSRLLEELAESVAGEGGATATTRAYVAEGDLAYAPLADWLRSDPLRPGLAALDDTARADLTRLLPELATGGSGGTHEAVRTASELRRSLFEAAVRVVRGVGRPVLLVLDDLQWCDRATLEFLHYLVRASADTPLLVAGTAREEELGADHPLTAVLDGLAELGRLRRLPLGPLAEQHVGALAEQLGAPMSDGAIRRLYRETEGNPLFVVETLRSGSEDAETVPPRVRSVLEARLARLSPAARELAGLAAVIGREFTYDVLRACSALSPDSLIPALDELWRRRIIREHGRGAYDFSHDKIREVAYAASGPARRRWLHLTAAQALLVVHADALDEVAGQVAGHFDRADAPAEVVRYYRLAQQPLNGCGPASRSSRCWAGPSPWSIPRPGPSNGTPPSWPCEPSSAQRWSPGAGTARPRLMPSTDAPAYCASGSRGRSLPRCCGAWRSGLWCAGISPRRRRSARSSWRRAPGPTTPASSRVTTSSGHRVLVRALHRCGRAPAARPRRLPGDPPPGAPDALRAGPAGRLPQQARAHPVVPR